MKINFAPIRWTVDGYVSEGFSVLAGRQKLGKTWLAIDWALAVATGGAAMGGIACDPGDVLYIDLENGPRRIQRRIDTLYPHGVVRPDLSRLEWVTDAPALDRGFIDALEDWRQSVPDPRLVVIDVLQRIKPAGSASRTAYENDYSIWSPLQKWATEHGIAVVGLHHTKKGGADDPLESLSGSNGLSACADTTLVLDMKGGERTLYVRGRDIEEKETALSFDGGLWSIKGDAAKVRMTGERAAILDALAGSAESMSPGDIADATRMPSQNVRQLLVSMVKAGEVVKAARGRYLHPHPHANADHIDHNITTDENDSNLNILACDPVCDRPAVVIDPPPVDHKRTAEKLNDINECDPVVIDVIDVMAPKADHNGEAAKAAGSPNAASRKHGASLLEWFAKPAGMSVDPRSDGYMLMRGEEPVRFVSTVAEGRKWIRRGGAAVGL
nr:AAA family ATPase [Ancylobacter tetraedralis]